jgi:hypothetical protein
VAKTHCAVIPSFPARLRVPQIITRRTRPVRQSPSDVGLLTGTPVGHLSRMQTVHLRASPSISPFCWHCQEQFSLFLAEAPEGDRI